MITIKIGGSVVDELHSSHKSQTSRELQSQEGTILVHGGERKLPRFVSN